jgi:uncharacterized protein (TIGR03435 family)
VFPILYCGAQDHTGIVFDVSSVKPAQSQSSHGYIRRLDIGIVSVSSMTLSEMIELFYYVRPYQIIGGPNWIREKRFDVTAKDSTISGSTQKHTGEEWSKAMEAEDTQMGAVLLDRFGLKMHYETRKLPALVLLAGPKVNLVAEPCSSTYTLQNGTVKGSIHLASFASLLKAELGKPVRDNTGLGDCYLIDKRWATDPTDDSLPSLATVLNELGLRLESTKGDVDVLVVDQVALPSPD